VVVDERWKCGDGQHWHDEWREHDDRRESGGLQELDDGSE